MGGRGREDSGLNFAAYSGSPQPCLTPSPTSRLGGSAITSFPLPPLPHRDPSVSHAQQPSSLPPPTFPSRFRGSAMFGREGKKRDAPRFLDRFSCVAEQAEVENGGSSVTNIDGRGQ